MGEFSVQLKEAQSLHNQAKTYENQSLNVSKRVSGNVTVRFENVN